MSPTASDDPQPQPPGTKPRPLLGAILTGVGCLASLVVAFFALSAAGFAAWMTALPPGMATMTREQANSQFRISAVVFLAACLAGVLLLIRIVYVVLRRGRNGRG